ncbi:hypothetical protein [Micromonospora sp. S-DT3-3-22]|uniref:hypothetical protein n=1 Tax=Micromonospora sp. S-DT3-3-22 TaxID=2755359 RepID=UPI00188F8F37|nr:hypothetical protein [Micromonospora sp. S-DT3-3-22]
MGSGGARNRSGPQPDPTSQKSAKRGVSLTALPAAGFDGKVPTFPLPRVPVYDVYFVDKQRVKEFDEKATAARRKRELALWTWAWRTPQAAAWSVEPWRWHAVAMWVRTSVICESAEGTAADKNSLHRFADQIGLTPAGLAFNGWKIAADQVAAKREEKAPTVPARSLARDRFKVVGGGA